MPRPNAPRAMGSETGLRRRVAYERELRGWSPASLASRMTQAGCAIHQSAIWKIENATRRISVDELVAFCRVFDMSERELLIPPELAVDLRAKRLAEGYETAIQCVSIAMGALVQHVDRNPGIREAVEQYISPLGRRIAGAFALDAIEHMRQRMAKMSDEEKQKMNESLYASLGDKTDG